MQSPLEHFDALLRGADPDSLDWADGRGAEQAEELLATLTREEWLQLGALCPGRETMWRACLASILHPRQDPTAGRLLLDFAWDPDPDVAFVAASAIAFHCGVNSSATGPFVDPAIRDPAFLSMARARTGLADQCRSVGATGHPHFQQTLGLLVAVLESDG